jgi:hypothetical protein
VRPLWVEITNKSNLRAALELRTCQQLGLSGEVAERRMRDAAETVKSQYIKVWDQTMHMLQGIWYRKHAPEQQFGQQLSATGQVLPW